MSTSAEPLRLLVIEDDEDDRYLITSALNENNINVVVTEVADGLEAIQFLENTLQQGQRLPHVIFLDINMPRLDGFGFLAALRENEVLSCIPTLVYTTSASEGDVRKCYSLGANAYIVKPLSFPEIRSTLATTCQYWLEHVNIVDWRKLEASAVSVKKEK